MKLQQNFLNCCTLHSIYNYFKGKKAAEPTKGKNQKQRQSQNKHKMSSYTCNTCGLAFPNPEGQRTHMKSDWHRYNLKRRVAQLPSISLDVFNEKVSVLGNKSGDADGNQQPQKGQSKNGKYEQQQTRKELKRLKKEELMRQRMDILEKARADILKTGGRFGGGEEADQQEEQPQQTSGDEVTKQQQEPSQHTTTTTNATEEVQDKEGKNEEELAEELMKLKLQNQVKIPPTTCLFCQKTRSFKDIDTNLNHMFKNHGLYIPEQKFLVNLEGLLEYLGEKIGLGNVCLVCNYQGKDLGAVRAHMLSKAHCKLPYENEEEKLEISEFYDFSSTYAKKAKKATNIVKVDGENAEDDGEWEDVSGEEDNEETNGSNEDNSDDEYEHNPNDDDDVLYNDGVELYLPSGLKVGHRSYARYFRQDLKPEKVLSEGQGTVIAAETRHLVSVVDKKEMDVQKRAWASEIKGKKSYDKKNQKHINFQPHYRDPLLQ